MVCLCLTPASGADLNQVVLDAIAGNQPVAGAGYSVGVMLDSQVVLCRGYGYRDKDLQLPVDSLTRFFIGSNTKSFTVLGLAMLRDRGVFDFDVPVTRYLPSFRTIDSSITAQITPADMLAHLTGLPRHDAFWLYTNLSRDDIVGRIRHLEMDYRPEMVFRGSFQYNNLMYMTAGTITEQLTGLSWEQFTRDSILTPLAMTNSGLGRTGFAGHVNASRPYNADGTLLGLPWENSDAVGPAGTIYSTAPDMLKYLQLYLRRGVTPGGDRLVSDSALVGIFTQRNDSKDRHLLAGAILTYYGMGWWVDYDGTHWAGYHGGGIGGYTSQMAFDQASRIAIVVLGNHRGEPAVNAIVTALLASLHGSPIGKALATAPAVIDDMPAKARSAPAPAALGKTGAASALDVVARFEHPGYGEMDIVRDSAGTYYQWFDNVWRIERSDTLYDYYLKGNASNGYTEWPSYLERDSTGDTVALLPALELYAISRFARTGGEPVMPHAVRAAVQRLPRVALVVGSGSVAVVGTMRAANGELVKRAFGLDGKMLAAQRQRMR